MTRTTKSFRYAYLSMMDHQGKLASSSTRTPQKAASPFHPRLGRSFPLAKPSLVTPQQGLQPERNANTPPVGRTGKNSREWGYCCSKGSARRNHTMYTSGKVNVETLVDRRIYVCGAESRSHLYLILETIIQDLPQTEATWSW